MPFIIDFPAPAMSPGGPTGSGNTSPRMPGPTATRRRVADNMDAEKQTGISDFSEVEQDDTNGSNASASVSASAPAGSNHHHHNSHLYPVIRYILLRTRILFCVPDSFVLCVEQFFLWVATVVQSMRSGRQKGRKILGILFLMVVMSICAKVSLIGGLMEVNGRSIENGQLILQRFKEDWASAQRVLTEIRTETSMPKRVLERVSVSENFLSFQSIGC